MALQRPTTQINRVSPSLSNSSSVASFILPKVRNSKCLIGVFLEIDVENYFTQFGKVVYVAIMRDKNTGRSRGFAFVTFETHSVEALHALK